MRTVVLITAFTLLAVFAASPTVLPKAYLFTQEVYVGVQSAFFGLILPPESDTSRVRFVGDVMLGRHVETLIKQHDSDYPYQRLEREPDTVWVGNFEAVAPNNHQQTKDFTLQLSVDAEHTSALEEFGMHYLSLANNHTLDFGREGFLETRTNLKSFRTFGHPSTIADQSVEKITTTNGVVGLLGIHAVNSDIDLSNLDDILYSLSLDTDVQVAYVHWGEEYTPVHNQAQETLAHTLIDAGIDVVIGHHPHVVQDIGSYKGKPIFYSLGNFIFDQYFDRSVQEGLVVELTLEEEGVNYTLLPVTAIDQAAAPRLMTESEKKAFLRNLALLSDVDLRKEIIDGQLQRWRD